MATRESIETSDHENIFGTLDLAPPRATTPTPPYIRVIPTQPIVLKDIYLLPRSLSLASLPRCGVFRTEPRTRSWRDREGQQPTNFASSPTRTAQRLRPRRRNLIRASSTWSGCWRDKPRATSFKPKRIAGSETASRSKEAAS